MASNPERSCPLCAQPMPTYREHVLEFHVGRQDLWHCGSCGFAAGDFEEMAVHCVRLRHDAASIRRTLETQMVEALAKIQAALPAAADAAKLRDKPSPSPMEEEIDLKVVPSPLQHEPTSIPNTSVLATCEAEPSLTNSASDSEPAEEELSESPESRGGAGDSEANAMAPLPTTFGFGESGLPRSPPRPRGMWPKGNVTCDLCSRVVRRNGTRFVLHSLITHVIIWHRDDNFAKMFACRLCHYTTDTRRNLATHFTQAKEDHPPRPSAASVTFAYPRPRLDAYAKLCWATLRDCFPCLSQNDQLATLCRHKLIQYMFHLD